MVKSKFKLYQIYENGKGNKVGSFICMIDAKSSNEALKKFKRIDKRKVVAVRDYGVKFFLPFTRGVFYYE